LLALEVIGASYGINEVGLGDFTNKQGEPPHSVETDGDEEQHGVEAVKVALVSRDVAVVFAMLGHRRQIRQMQFREDSTNPPLAVFDDSVYGPDHVSNRSETHQEEEEPPLVTERCRSSVLVLTGRRSYGLPSPSQENEKEEPVGAGLSTETSKLDLKEAVNASACRNPE
jgi:hypothetical protein